MSQENPYSKLEDLTPGQERSRAIVAHLLGVFFSFIAPLVAYLLYKNRGKFIRHHVTEALNFALTMVILGVALVAAVLLSLGLVILVALPALLAVVLFIGLGQLIFGIIAAYKANQGEFYRYPISIRLIKNNK